MPSRLRGARPSRSPTSRLRSHALRVSKIKQYYRVYRITGSCPHRGNERLKTLGGSHFGSFADLSILQDLTTRPRPKRNNTIAYPFSPPNPKPHRCQNNFQTVGTESSSKLGLAPRRTNGGFLRDTTVVEDGSLRRPRRPTPTTTSHHAANSPYFVPHPQGLVREPEHLLKTVRVKPATGTAIVEDQRVRDTRGVRALFCQQIAGFEIDIALRVLQPAGGDADRDGVSEQNEEYQTENPQDDDSHDHAGTQHDDYLIAIVLVATRRTDGSGSQNRQVGITSSRDVDIADACKLAASAIVDDMF